MLQLFVHIHVFVLCHKIFLLFCVSATFSIIDMCLYHTLLHIKYILKIRRGKLVDVGVVNP
jgi:hypothetical protein